MHAAIAALYYDLVRLELGFDSLCFGKQITT